MGTQMGQRVVKGTFQMLKERFRKSMVIIEIYHFFQNTEISCFFYISGSSGDQPERVVVETASDVGVSFLCQRLVLMVSASIFKLCCRNIKNSLAGAVRDQVYETEKILTGISEAHAPSCTGFKVRGGTGHIKGHHTLILVPDVYHAVKLFVSAFYGIAGQKFFPVVF